MQLPSQLRDGVQHARARVLKLLQSHFGRALASFSNGAVATAKIPNAFLSLCAEQVVGMSASKTASFKKPELLEGRKQGFLKVPGHVLHIALTALVSLSSGLRQPFFQICSLLPYALSYVHHVLDGRPVAAPELQDNVEEIFKGQLSVYEFVQVFPGFHHFLRFLVVVEDHGVEQVLVRGSQDLALAPLVDDGIATLDILQKLVFFDVEDGSWLTLPFDLVVLAAGAAHDLAPLAFGVQHDLADRVGLGVKLEDLVHKVHEADRIHANLVQRHDRIGVLHETFELVLRDFAVPVCVQLQHDLAHLALHVADLALLLLRLRHIAHNFT
mmetsp:Transcript_124196/g.397506  ORF Transcript_124196/g.397506 Transcript_124196/m.397506 type:complete len:327 (+) Transcript_124196:562-1542(+)